MGQALGFVRKKCKTALCYGYLFLLTLSPVLIAAVVYFGLEFAISHEVAFIVSFFLGLALTRSVKPLIQRSSFALFSVDLGGRIIKITKYLDIVIQSVILVVVFVINISAYVYEPAYIKQMTSSVNASFVVYIAYLRVENAVRDFLRQRSMKRDSAPSSTRLDNSDAGDRNRSVEPGADAVL